MSRQQYLAPSTYIDWQTAEVQHLALSLAQGAAGDEAIAKKCFEWVRDQIKHSVDYQLNPVTCKASEVLRAGTGYCYAKSHLLAALLRANQIPCGLCYQRLSLDETGPPYCLHGLNAVYLAEHGWYRIDARGNKPGVNAQFSPPVEQLAFPILDANETDLVEIWAEPLAIVVRVLGQYDTYDQVYNHLPDIERVRSHHVQAVGRQRA